MPSKRVIRLRDEWASLDSLATGLRGPARQRALEKKRRIGELLLRAEASGDKKIRHESVVTYEDVKNLGKL